MDVIRGIRRIAIDTKCLNSRAELCSVSRVSEDRLMQLVLFNSGDHAAIVMKNSVFHSQQTLSLNEGRLTEE